VPHPHGAGGARRGRGFVDDIFGGSIPKNWILRREGHSRSAERGFRPGSRSWISGPRLYDGKYHDVDSSTCFQDRRVTGVKEAMKQARPPLLEPVMHVEVYAPDQYSGDIMAT